MFLIVYFMTKYESTFNVHLGYEVSYDWDCRTMIRVIVISILAGISTSALGISLAFLCAPLLQSLNFPEEISEHTPIFIEL